MAQRSHPQDVFGGNKISREHENNVLIHQIRRMRGLINIRIEGMQKEQTRLRVPFQIPEKVKDKSGADRGGCSHADAECGGLTL